jgi:hypothetical protein
VCTTRTATHTSGGNVAERGRSDACFLRSSLYRRRSTFRLADDAPCAPHHRRPMLVLRSSSGGGHNWRHAVIDLDMCLPRDPTIGTNKSRNKLAHATNGNTMAWRNDGETTTGEPPAMGIAPHDPVEPATSDDSHSTGRHLADECSDPVSSFSPTHPPGGLTDDGVHLNGHDDAADADRIAVDAAPVTGGGLTTPFEPDATPDTSSSHHGADSVASALRRLSLANSIANPSTTSPDARDRAPCSDPIHASDDIPPGQPTPVELASSHSAGDEAIPSSSRPDVASTNEDGDSSPMPGHPTIPAVGPFVSLSPTQPMPRASTPTDDDGTADRCAHNGCTQQIWAVCVAPQCQRPLCVVHFGPCRMAPPYAPSRCHEHGESTALCPCADCGRLRTPSLPLAPGRQSQRILTSDELAVVQANRERALILRQLKQAVARDAQATTLTTEQMRRIACNRAAAVALKRRLGEAPNGQPAASRPRLSSPPCPGLNLPPGWHRDGWVAPTVPDEPLDFRTGPVPQAALAYACTPRSVASPDKPHQQQLRAPRSSAIHSVPVARHISIVQSTCTL